MRLLLLLLAGAAGLAASDDLLAAVAREDLAAIDRALGAGADVRAANRYGITPLALACEAGNLEVAQRLVDAGADVNARGPGGETMLMVAARTGKLNVVRFLLAKGADSKATETTREQTALMWAAAEGHADVITELVKAGADISRRSPSGLTALLFAARDGQLAAVRALLAAGADPNDTVQPTPGYQGMIWRGGSAPRPGSSALHLAVLSGHFELAARLLDAGADPNANGPGYTPLHAVHVVRKPGVGDNNPAPLGSGNMSSLEFVRFLKSKGASLNARMTKKVGLGLTAIQTLGATPFFLAAKSADAELMRELARLGADITIPNVDGATAVHAAAGLGTRSPGEDAGTEPEVMEALTVAIQELGLSPNTIDKNGETPMHGAAYKNLPGAVHTLAKLGADPKIWNNENRMGWTPVRIAEGYRFGNYKPSPETVAALLEVLERAGLKPKPCNTPGKSDY